MSLVAAKSSKLIKVIFVKMVMTDPDPDPNNNPDPDDDEDALKSVDQWWEKRDPKCIICTDRGLSAAASPTLPHSLATNLFANENAKARFEKM